jgi:error-prone DNA polymerase
VPRRLLRPQTESVARPAGLTYVELHCHSAYSFLDGASQPEELAARAARLGYPALALTDHDGLYGSLELAHAAKALGLRPITGAEVTLADGSHLTLLVESRRGYANLCRLITAAHAGTRPAEKAEPLPARLSLELLLELKDGLVCLSGCARRGLAVRDPAAAARLARAFGRDRFYVELQRPYERGDVRRNASLRCLAESLGVRAVATGNVHAHRPERALLQDALVAVRRRAPLERCEQERRGNRACVLLAPAEARERFADVPEAVAETALLAERLEFDLSRDLGYRYPDFSQAAEPAEARLRRICEQAFAERYPAGSAPLRAKARERLEEELRLICELGLAGFFCLHHEILELAREVAEEVRGPGSPRRALPPGRGRGSSVGSLVCYLTGLSHVDPVAAGLSLGRFLNREMASVPDIDLDFPRDIRERLIVRVIERYGRERAALVASFSTYHARSAIRDLGMALGLPRSELERLACLSEGDPRRVGEEIAALPDGRRKLASRRWRALAWLCGEIAGLPRHLSQHPGGMVVSSQPLIELVPVQPGATAGRQICQWDKDSCADAGFLKIDLLGLGMLSAVEECVEQIARGRGEAIDLSRIPLDDAGVYEEIQRADTVGAFQIESRAQMQSLVRTRPQSLEDLTIQVALVRPGPIQGGAVHPYLERRERRLRDPRYEPPVEHPLLAEPLRETLGVVVFQDQVLEVATALAGFSVGEAEGLRRAMSRKRSREALEAYRERFLAGAASKGVDAATAGRVYDALAAFSGFGFPKSHAAAFALLAYQSAWLRRHYPAEFLCALLNAQPMGFYPPATLVREAERRGVRVLPPDVNRSAARSSLEGGAVRLGLASVQGVGEKEAEAVAAGQPYASIADLAQRAPVGRDALRALVEAGACDCLGRPRRALLWELGLVPRPQPLPGSGGRLRQLPLPLQPTASTPELAEETAWERMLAEYRALGLSLGPHPLALLRPHLPEGTARSADLAGLAQGARVAVAGLVVARQRPATAKGVVFLLLEDEQGLVSLVLPPPAYERQRALVRGEPLLLARGRLETRQGSRAVRVERLESLRPLLVEAAGLRQACAVLPRPHHFGKR